MTWELIGLSAFICDINSTPSIGSRLASSISAFGQVFNRLVLSLADTIWFRATFPTQLMLGLSELPNPTVLKAAEIERTNSSTASSTMRLATGSSFESSIVSLEKEAIRATLPGSDCSAR